MSAFLGPIHVKMYARILHQDAMAQALVDLATKNNWNDAFIQEVDLQAPAASHAPLEAIVDANNIHGWLSQAVSRCERRFAMVVCGLLAGHMERVDALCAAMNALGRTQPLPPAMDAEQAFEAIGDYLLDGMPCDFPFVPIHMGADTVTWQVKNCPHVLYWADSACGIEIYYQLRDAWIAGALKDSGITHTRPELYIHTLRREG